MTSNTNSACIDACNACAVACNACASACLQEDDVKMMAGCIALDIDCAQVCSLAAAMLARDSAHAMQVCRLCAEVCKACADECSQHVAAHCKACAEACRSCAAACIEMNH